MKKEVFEIKCKISFLHIKDFWCDFSSSPLKNYIIFYDVSIKIKPNSNSNDNIDDLIYLIDENKAGTI